MITKNLSKSPYFYILNEDGKWRKESPWSRQMRMIVWGVLEKHTPNHKHVISRRQRGDIRGAFDTVCRFGQENLFHQKMSLRKQVMRYEKQDKVSFSEYVSHFILRIRYARYASSVLYHRARKRQALQPRAKADNAATRVFTRL